MHRNLIDKVLSTNNKAKLTPYEEICAIKDRLYRDIVRLEEIQGREVAHITLTDIMNALTI